MSSSSYHYFSVGYTADKASIWVKSRSILIELLPLMLLPGRICGQHNSVKLQYSLTFNFLCMFSLARRGMSTSKELAFLELLLKCSCKLSAAILLVFRAVKAILWVCQEKHIMDVFQHKKHWQCTQGYLCSFRKYRLDIHFRIHEIDSNL